MTAGGLGEGQGCARGEGVGPDGAGWPVTLRSCQLCWGKHHPVSQRRKPRPREGRGLTEMGLGSQLC